MDKKKLLIWSLYDFANSIVFIVFFLYYSQWLVIDHGLPDLWFNATFVGSSILFILIAPVAGSIADKLKVRLPGLRITTILSFIFFLLTALIAVFYPDYYILSIITFTLATFFYLFCFTYYNPMLEDVALPEKQGLASGWGQFGNWLGQIFGLLITLPIATGAIILFSSASTRAQTLIPASLLFFIFSLPIILLFKESARKKTVPISIREEYRNIISSTKDLFKSVGVGRFFLAYFLFNDAIITSSNNFPIYLEKLFGVDDTTKSFLLLGILVTSAIGALLSGWIADKIGFKKTLLGVLAGWLIIFPAMAITKNFSFFIIISLAMGLWFGPIWTVSRAFLLQLTPRNMLNKSFTFYTLFERFATFIGPLSWGLIVTLIPKTGNMNYRVAAFSMTIFIILGLIIASKLPSDSLRKKII
ncbi:MAG: MFS transporter [Patescibacteria group bacterium]